MKQNLRKVLAMLVLSASVMGLTACGSSDADTGLTYDEAYLHSVADFLIGNWDAMSMEEIASYASLDSEDAEAMIESYGLPFTAEAFTTAFATPPLTAKPRPSELASFNGSPSGSSLKFTPFASNIPCSSSKVRTKST